MLNAYQEGKAGTEHLDDAVEASREKLYVAQAEGREDLGREVVEPGRS